MLFEEPIFWLFALGREFDMVMRRRKHVKLMLSFFEEIE